MKKILLTTLTLCFLCTWACMATLALNHSKNHPEDQASGPELAPGTLTDSVYCRSDSSQFYAVYLPSGYEPSRAWPILYFFEPGARAKLPLGLYQSIAEKYGWIMACSYTSRNGPIANNETSYRHMSEDLKERLNLDASRVYFSGFSGGGRFSQYMAQKYPATAGVISVAGPKGDGPLLDLKVFNTPYVGIVGDRDMNYLEHSQFHQTLAEAAIPNTLITYSAAHQWPPSEVYQGSVAWHHAQYLQAQNDPALTGYLEEMIYGIDTASMDLLDKHRLYSAFKVNFNQRADSDVAQKIMALENDKDFKKFKKQQDRILVAEQKSQLEYVKALAAFRNYYFQPGVNPDSSEYSKKWWSLEIKSLSNKASANSLKGLSSARLIDFLRGQVHNRVQEAKSLLQPQLIMDMHEINLMLYPNSVWFLWNQAILCAQYGREKEAVDYVRQAEKTGQQMLDNLRANPQFQALKGNYGFLFN